MNGPVKHPVMPKNIFEQDVFSGMPTYMVQVDEEVWTISFTDRADQVVNVLASSSRPKIVRKNIRREFVLSWVDSDKAWEYELSSEGVPEDAYVRVDPSFSTDSELRTATWWVVEL